MKYKTDFVTNSSSSSFILLKKNLSDLQMDMIRNYFKIAKELELPSYKCTWQIKEDNDSFIFDTSMDNFDMLDYLKRAGIDISNDIIYDDDYVDHY